MNAKDQETEKKSKSTNSKRNLYILSGGIIVVVGVVFILLYMSTVRRVQYVYTNQTYQSAVTLKQEAVGRTVENLVAEIDQIKTMRMNDEQALLQGISPAVRATMEKDAGKTTGIRAFFADNAGLKNITFVVYDAKSKKIALDERGIAGESGLWLDDTTQAFVQYDTVEVDGQICVYGITDSAFDAEMRSIMDGRLQIVSEEEGTMYWIDSVTRLDNGTIRTTRVADPVNPARVGMSLDTRGTGNGPDRFATEGLLDVAEGEQLIGRDTADWTDEDGKTVTTPTVTCAQYYAPYEWAVCGAFRLDKIGAESIDLQDASRKETMRLGVRLAIGFAVVLAIAIALVLLGNARYFKLRQKKLKDQVEKDALTGANTRGYGTQILQDAFRRFHDGAEPSPAIMVLDVDKFKTINDTYGHDAGDEALRRVVKSATRVMRGKDCVIRWGGDEFIAVFFKLEHARSEAVANRLRKAICDTPVLHGNQEFQVTVSVGVTWYRFGDSDFNDALKRADAALYVSKEEGRNRVCVADGRN